jgi:ribosomal protein S18 acetylase RimI-like enzyme
VADIEWMLNAVEENVGESYRQSSLGWSRRDKRKELMELDSRYILLLLDSVKVGFCMYQLSTEESVDHDTDIPVLYCYELHLLPQVRGQGHGKRLMQTMEAIGRQHNMLKVMLTTFKANTTAIAFYNSIGYSIDGISPSRYVPSNDYDYEILSKVLV